MNRSRLAAVVAASIAILSSALTAGSFTTSASAQSASAEVTSSPLRLNTPAQIHAYYYRGHASFDAGIRLIAQNSPFEIWSKRPTYDDQIQMELRTGGQTIQLPEGLANDFRGLPDFIKIYARDEGGNLMGRSSHDVCLNGYSERMSPDAPISSPYPWGCPWNRYTLGSVQGIQEGWATRTEIWGGMKIAPGTYQAKAFIPLAWRDVLGITKEEGTSNFTLVVDGEFSGCRGCREVERPGPQPAAQEPTSPRAGAPAGVMPDLRSLPAFGIQIDRSGDYLAFSANVWNAGDSPLVVDGFRDPGEDLMTAYQYFVDENGEQTGYQQVGTMEYHEQGGHNHWHFTDFARYRLLNADMTEAVRSRKEAFCLANTDAIDYTVPGADWRPEQTDLHTACGDRDSLSLREVLSSGSGDTYAQWRAGQSFNLKGLPNGTYYIAVEANPEGNLIEHSTENNVSYRKVIIGGVPGDRTVRLTRIGIV